MGIFQIILILATFLCSLVAGFLFAFAVVAMPGIGSLNDREFIQAFQVMDRVIQNNQPIFLFVWVGSVVALIASVVLGIGQLDGAGRLLIIFAALAYLLGVQLPTVTINGASGFTVGAPEMLWWRDGGRGPIRRSGSRLRFCSVGGFCSRVPFV